MNAAIAALEKELTKAEAELEKVKTETKYDIEQGDRARRTLEGARGAVADLKAAIAVVTPKPLEATS